MKGIYKIYSCPAGEHLVLGELLKRKYPAYLANGKTQPCWDIIIIKESKTIKIQVKTIDWPNETAVNGKFDTGYDFLVIVLLNRNSEPRYLIIPQQDTIRFCSKENIKRNDKNRTINVAKKYEKNKKKNFKQYENKWEMIK